MRDIIIHLVSLHYQTQITIHLLKEIYLLFLKNMLYFLFDPPITGPINDTSLEHPYNTNYKYDNSLVKYYLEYVKSGGNLIVLDSEYGYNINNNVPANSNGIFAELLSIEAGDGSNFNVSRNPSYPSDIVGISSSTSAFACESLYILKC